MKKIILASQSPRRKEILQDLGYTFDVIPSLGDEVFDKTKSIDDALMEVSYAKGKDIFNQHKDAIVISADTIVVLDNIILGKPVNKEQAIAYLLALSNRYHEVKTGVSIFFKNEVIQTVGTIKRTDKCLC